VVNRFGEFFRDVSSMDAISGDDLTRFVVALKRDHKFGTLARPYTLGCAFAYAPSYLDALAGPSADQAAAR